MIEFRKGGFTNPSDAELPFSTAIKPHEKSYLEKAGDVAKWVGETAYGSLRKGVKSLGAPGALIETAGNLISKAVPESVKNVISKPSEWLNKYVPFEEEGDREYATPENIEKRLIKPVEEYLGIPKGYGEGKDKVQKFVTEVAGALPLTILGVSTMPKAIASAIGSEIGSRAGGTVGKTVGTVAGYPKLGEAAGTIGGSILGGGVGIGALGKAESIASHAATKEGVINKMRSIPEGWNQGSLAKKINQNIEETYAKANSEYKAAPDEWKTRDAGSVWDAVEETEKSASRNTKVKERIQTTIDDLKERFTPSKESIEKQTAEEAKLHKAEMASREKELTKTQKELKLAQRENNKAKSATAKTIAPSNQKEVNKERQQSLKTLTTEKAKVDQEARKLKTQYTRAKKHEETLMKKGRVGQAAQKRSEYKKAKLRADELEKQSLSQNEKITKIKEDIKKENISREETLKKMKTKAREKLEKVEDKLFNLKKQHKRTPITIKRKPTPEDIRFEKKQVSLDDLVEMRKTVGHNMNEIPFWDKESKGKLKYLYKKLSEEIEKAAAENPSWGEPFMDATAAYGTVAQKTAIDYIIHPPHQKKLFGTFAAIRAATHGLPSLGKAILGLGAAHVVAPSYRYASWALTNPTIRKEVQNVAEAAMHIKLNPKHVDKATVAMAVRSIKNIGKEVDNMERMGDYKPQFRKGGFINQ